MLMRLINIEIGKLIFDIKIILSISKILIELKKFQRS